MDPYLLPSFHNKFNFYMTYFEKFSPLAEGALWSVEGDREFARAAMEQIADKVCLYAFG
jgi:hypothetical protein